MNEPSHTDARLASGEIGNLIVGETLKGSLRGDGDNDEVVHRDGPDVIDIGDGNGSSSCSGLVGGVQVGRVEAL